MWKPTVAGLYGGKVDFTAQSLLRRLRNGVKLDGGTSVFVPVIFLIHLPHFFAVYGVFSLLMSLFCMHDTTFSLAGVGSYAF